MRYVAILFLRNLVSLVWLLALASLLLLLLIDRKPSLTRGLFKAMSAVTAVTVTIALFCAFLFTSGGYLFLGPIAVGAVVTVIACALAWRLIRRERRR